MNEYVVGYTREYINDFPEWRMFSVIPEVAAMVWLQQSCSQHPYLDGWMNKGWVVVENEPPYDIALYNHDGRFYIYRRKRMIERRGPARLPDKEYVELCENLGFEVPERLKPIVLTPFEEEYVRELRMRIEECATM